jgi:hypothetical protein
MLRNTGTTKAPPEGLPNTESMKNIIAFAESLDLQNGYAYEDDNTEISGEIVVQELSADEPDVDSSNERISKCRLCRQTSPTLFEVLPLLYNIDIDLDDSTDFVASYETPNDLEFTFTPSFTTSTKSSTSYGKDTTRWYETLRYYLQQYLFLD